MIPASRPPLLMFFPFTRIEVHWSAAQLALLLPAVVLAGIAGWLFLRHAHVRASRLTALGLILAVRALLFAGYYDPATNWLHGDDYIRANMAVECAHGRAPHPDHRGCDWCDERPGAWMLAHRGPIAYPGDLSWLPLQFWVYGLATPIAGRDLHLVFTLLSEMLMAAGTLFLYDFVRVLFDGRVAGLTALLWALTSWQIILAHGCLAEPLALAVSFAALAAFARWLRDGRARQAVAMMAAFTLLALTRYEGWILLGLICVPLGWRLVRGGVGTGLRKWAAWAALTVPWVLPALWCLESRRLYANPLNYYEVNRYWFNASPLGEMGAFERLIGYPKALWETSIPIVVLFVAGLGSLAASRFRTRSTKKAGAAAGGDPHGRAQTAGTEAGRYRQPEPGWSTDGARDLRDRAQTAGTEAGRYRGCGWPADKGRTAQLLMLAITGLHLAVLVTLFVRGSAPLFVHRIVLFHFAVMLPFAVAWLCPPPDVRAPVRAPPGRRFAAIGVALVIIYAARQFAWTGALFQESWFTDHRGVHRPYAELGKWLREHVPDNAGRVAMSIDDRDQIIATIAGLPRRVRGVTRPEDVPTLGEDHVVAFAVLTRDLGRGYDAAMERAFVDRHAGRALDAAMVGPWRVYTSRR